jgi:hypothetical protein
VPNADDGWNFWKDGMGAGASIEHPEYELRANFGPTQIRLQLCASDGEASSWPGEIRVWVNDIRDPLDKFYMLGNTIGKTIVDELVQPVHGGELAMKLHDPFRGIHVIVTEAPTDMVPDLQDLPRDACEHDLDYPPPKKQALAIFDAILDVPNYNMLEGIVRFYNHFLMTEVQPPGQKDQQVMLHFGPADILHQTITFRVTDRAEYRNLGKVGMYLHTKQKFHLCFVRTKGAGLLLDNTTWDEAQANGEYRMRAIQDPQSKSELIPLIHVIRSPLHPEFPLAEHTSDISRDISRSLSKRSLRK